MNKQGKLRIWELPRGKKVYVAWGSNTEEIKVPPKSPYRFPIMGLDWQAAGERLQGERKKGRLKKGRQIKADWLVGGNKRRRESVMGAFRKGKLSSNRHLIYHKHSLYQRAATD